MFCPYCGYRLRDEYLFCKNCGRKVEKDPLDSSNPKETASRMSFQPASSPPIAVHESVLAGFSSADMMRPGSMGYGIYVTTGRVIGVKSPQQFAKAVGGAIAGAVIGKLVGFEAPWAISSALGRNLTNDETMRLLTELERNRDFEINNQDITLVQLKQPFFTQLGYLALFVKGQTKTEIVIKFGKDKVYEMLKDMFKTHFPNVLRTTI